MALAFCCCCYCCYFTFSSLHHFGSLFNRMVSFPIENNDDNERKRHTPVDKSLMPKSSNFQRIHSACWLKGKKRSHNRLKSLAIFLFSFHSVFSSVCCVLSCLFFLDRCRNLRDINAIFSDLLFSVPSIMTISILVCSALFALCRAHAMEEDNDSERKKTYRMTRD